MKIRGLETKTEREIKPGDPIRMKKYPDGKHYIRTSLRCHEWGTVVCLETGSAHKFDQCEWEHDPRGFIKEAE